MITKDDSPTTAPPTSLWRNRDFNLLWTSQMLSQLGAATTLLAVPLVVLAVTGSATKAGVVGSVAAVVSAVVQLPSGAIADRWNRRAVMLTCDAARILLLSALALLIWSGHATFLVILVLASGATIFDATFEPAETAATSQLVPSEQLSDAFARVEARSYGISLLGPSLGGVLYAIGRAFPFAFDVLSYVVSFVAVARIRRPMQGERRQSSQAMIADIADGVRHVFGAPFLRGLLLVAAPLNFAATGVLFTTTLSLRESGHSASLIGLAQGVIGLGGFLGAIAAPRLQRRLSLRSLVITAACTLTVCFAAASTTTAHLVVAIPLALGFFTAPAANAAIFGHMAATTPEELQGRVVSVVLLAATGAATLAPVIAGTLTEHVAGAAAMSLFAGCVGLAGLTAIFGTGMRES